MLTTVNRLFYPYTVAQTNTEKTMNLCKDCKFYKAGANVAADKCHHPKSETRDDYNGIREALPIRWYSCNVMRGSDCEDGKLFEASAS